METWNRKQDFMNSCIIILTSEYSVNFKMQTRHLSAVVSEMSKFV